jgi:hypothetical protein
MEQRQISLQPKQIVHVALLPPIRSPPVELLANIFSLCMPEYPAPGLQIPLILGRVCRHWRAITLSMGNLWRSMDLALDVLNPHTQAAQVQSWLSRSSGYPLSIIFRYVGDISKYTQPLVNTLLEHSQRWEYIELHVTGPFVQAFAPAKGRMALLQQLQLCLVGEGRTSFDMMIDAFVVAPKLHSVVLHAHASSLRLPWEQLTECTISASIYAILEFLRLTPNLVNCCLDDCFWGYHIAEPPPEFPRISNLLSLHLVQITRGSGLFILQYITLPFLRDITFDIYDMAEWPQEDFMEFLLRSACPLERLALLRVLLTLQDLTKCLQALPSLLELEIDRARILEGEGEGHQPILNDELLLRLTPGVRLGEIKQPILLPQLQVIKFGLLDCHDNNLADMINSRWSQPSTPVSRLKSVHLKYHREWERGVMSRLEQFEAQGLQLSVMNRDIIYDGQMAK